MDYFTIWKLTKKKMFCAQCGISLKNVFRFVVKRYEALRLFTENEKGISWEM